jgi:hypothetical protein
VYEPEKGNQMAMPKKAMPPAGDINRASTPPRGGLLFNMRNLASYGFRITIDDSEEWFHIDGSQNMTEEAHEAGRKFGNEIGLDDMQIEQMFEFAMDLALWSNLRKAIKGE